MSYNKRVYHYAVTERGQLLAACGRIQAVRMTLNKKQVNCQRCVADGWTR